MFIKLDGFDNLEKKNKIYILTQSLLSRHANSTALSVSYSLLIELLVQNAFSGVIHLSVYGPEEAMPDLTV